MPATPIVADQIDRGVEALQFTLQPVPVGDERGRESVGQCSAEPRGDNRTTSSRPSYSTSGPQIASVSGLPCTRITVMVPILARRAPTPWLPETDRC